ncbi:MAG: nicotinate-nucleotide--dimethylbenzimidazole phosphoribosyltransferase [Egibacteraceae bacterium]
MSRPPPSAALAATLSAIAPADAESARAAERRIASLAIPPGSLGRLGALAVRLAGSAGRCPPPLPKRPVLVVAAGDHGVHAHGVSPWPQGLTAAMAATLAEGAASGNALARAVGARVVVLDAGIAGAPAAGTGLERAGVRAGTGDLAAGPALDPGEADAAVRAGIATAEQALAEGADLLVTGDMGIANTTAAACLLAALAGRPAEEVVGPGAAGPAANLVGKRALVAAAVARADLDGGDGLGALAAFGGLEHAALAGVCLAGARARVPVVLDGVSAVAAALAAARLAPATVDHLVAGHRSPEPGASVGLAVLGLDPLLDVGMALGEGTGALLAVPLVTAAARVLAEVRTLEDLARAGWPLS